MTDLARIVSIAALAACSAPQAPAQPQPQPQPQPQAPPAAAAPAAPAAPAATPIVVADADPGFAFLDPDRRTKLAAAFPAIDAAIAGELTRQSLPGLAIGIVIDGELAYAKGFGVTDPETKAKPDADTVYRIGSISKSVTGLAVLALRDAGALGLDDPLARWIPEAAQLIYPSRDARPITLRQVLSHTSGLPRMGPFDPDHGPDEAAVTRSLAKLPLESAPGTVNSYSNLGFSLLGIVAAHAARKPFHDVVREHLFAPLGMTSTYWDHAEVPAGRLAPAFQPGPGGPKRKEPIRLGAADGAGGIYSTVRDLARYAAAQLAAYPPRHAPDTGTLRRATLREAHSTGVLVGASAAVRPAPKPGEPLLELNANAYGFGFAERRTCDLDDLVGHGGAIDSYRAELWMLRDRGVGIVALSNFGTANLGAVVDRVVRELVGTGALAERVPRPAPAFAGILQQFLAVYHRWDDAGYRAMLDPDRGPVPEEQAELAGYHKLHGACTAGPPVEVASPFRARWKLACERGSLVMAIDLVPRTGLIGGFFGISRDVAPPPEIAKLGGALAGLIGKWSDAAYPRTPALRTTRDGAKTLFADLRSVHGACHVRAPVHEGFDWQLELDCDRGGGLTLVLVHDPQKNAVVDFAVRRRVPPGMRCPVR